MNTQELIKKIECLDESFCHENEDRRFGYSQACEDILGILWNLEDNTIAVEVNDETLSNYFIGRNIDAYEMFKCMIKYAE